MQTQSDGNAKKERKGKEKKERKGKEIIIPSLIEFCDYVKLQIPNEYSQIEKSLKLKYEAWKINEWKDGYNTPIINWKAKVLNTIQHLKKESNFAKQPEAVYKNDASKWDSPDATQLVISKFKEVGKS